MAEVNWAAIRERALGGFAASSLPPTLKLPSLPHAVTLFVQKAGDPKATVGDLAKIVQTDTGLTVELLKYVNSSFVGLRQKASSVQAAISLIGIRQSRMLLVATGMEAAVRARNSKLINQGCFWNASLQKALFAKEVAVLLKADGDTAFAGALLQDYLLPVLTNDLYDGYLDFVQSREGQPESICEFESKKFGFDHSLAAGALAHRWNLPDELICCILHHHEGLRILADPELGRSSVAAVALSALLPDQLRQQYRGLEQLMKLGEKWKAFNLEELAGIVDEKHAELGLGVRNDFPLSRRCSVISTDPSSYSDGTLYAVAAG
ncbi:MAG: HDOD domain-containing protein [Planctomycetaceae bacterium]